MKGKNMKTAKKKAAPRKAKTAQSSAPETVLVLRTCDADMKGYGGFQWPTSGLVEAPDWNPKAECGTGLHGWLWGAGDWSLKRPGDAKWVVVEVEKSTIVDLNGKVKFPRGVVRAVCSNWQDAMAIIRPKMPVATGNIASGDYGHAAASGDSGHAAASGDSGHAAASGDSGHAAASGDSGHAAASGDSGHAAASGDSGHAAASGDYGHAAASGDSGHAAASGDFGHAAASGDSGHAAASGYYGHAAASGYYGHAAASGYSGHAAASGYYGHAAASGYSGHAAASGYYGHAAASGDSGHAAASGYYGHAAASGDSGHAAASGYSGHAAASGYYGHAAASGEEGVAFAGIGGIVKAGPVGAIIGLYRDAAKRKRVLVGYVGEDGIESGQWYSVSLSKNGASFVKATGCADCDAVKSK